MNFIVNEQLISIREKCRNLKPLVVIHCLTYNHELYLRDALEGFVMQKTNFPFVAIVHEDASTDKTADILREYAEKYPDIILPIFEKENQYSKGDGSLSKIYNFALDASGAKYVAICEGDDYWIDPNKLQKQVDFLESHPNYGMVYGISKQYVQKDKKFINNRGNEYKNINELIILPYNIPTATLLFNKNIKDEAYKKYIGEKKWKMGDYPLSLAIASHSKIKFIPEEMSVYRIIATSACHFNNYEKEKDFYLSSYNLKLYFAKIHGISIDNNMKNLFYLGLYNIALKYNHSKESYKIAKKLKKKGIKKIIFKIINLNYFTYLFYYNLIKYKINQC